MTANNAIELAHAAAMPAPMGGALPTGLEWQALERMANTLADSDVIPYRLKRKPADVAVILLAAREYGVPPLMALSKLPVVNGTPAPMGELMVALVLRAGHYIGADFRNPDGSVYKGGPLTPQHYGEARYKRRDWDEREVMTFTLEEALNASLLDRITPDGKAIARVTKTKNGHQVEEVTPWEQYTPNMARWRAVANACRLTFPDVLLGLSYLPEELGAVVDADGAPVEAEVVPPRGAPATGTIEQRTAQEAADKLAEQPWHDGVIAALRKTATEGGYLDATVTYVGESMTFAEALTRHVDDRQHADTVDAELVDDEATVPEGSTDTPEEHAAMIARMAVEEAASAPPAAEEPPAEAPAPSTPPPAPSAPAEESDQDAAYDVAREALVCRDVEVLRTFYRGSAELRAFDVLPVLGDDDLAAIDAPPDLPAMALGAFLIAAGKYVERHGAAIRDVAEPMTPVDPAQAAQVEDPWAGDAAEGWPAVAQPPA